MPDCRRNCGSCVDFPLPVSPTKMVVACALMICSSSHRTSAMGRNLVESGIALQALPLACSGMQSHTTVCFVIKPGPSGPLQALSCLLNAPRLLKQLSCGVSAVCLHLCGAPFSPLSRCWAARPPEHFGQGGRQEKRHTVASDCKRRIYLPVARWLPHP